MKLIKWFVINALMIGFTVTGFIYGVEGAQNVSILFAWFCLVVSIAYLDDNYIKNLSKEKRTMPSGVDFTLDIILTIIFAWHGATLTAIAYLIHTLLVENGHNAAKKIKKENNIEDAEIV